MNIDEFISRFNQYFNEKVPFIFAIDYAMKKPLIYSLDEAKERGILYHIHSHSNTNETPNKRAIQLESNPIDFASYRKSLDYVVENINNGNSYLLNLTFPSEVKINLSLEEIFHIAVAPYKLLIKDECVIFSPEAFVYIKGNKISTYPMKGTIDATIVNAEEILLANKKEEWEHNTIVDLMRNDLAMIAENIEVESYRYVEEIVTNKGRILQTSSKIRGTLSQEVLKDLGRQFIKLLPAGSITGAPKAKTLEIISEAEIDDRNYYTGVFGIFDGESLDSAVSIRYIEKRDGKHYFRSGGGITSNSDALEEYNELIQKIYVPAI